MEVERQGIDISMIVASFASRFSIVVKSRFLLLLVEDREKITNLVKIMIFKVVVQNGQQTG